MALVNGFGFELEHVPEQRHPIALGMVEVDPQQPVSRVGNTREHRPP